MLLREHAVTATIERTKELAIQQEATIPRARNPEELVELFSKDVWRFASAQIARREDAEDIVMEVFAAACSNFQKVYRTENQRIWLLSITRKKVIDHLRRQYRRAEQPISSAEMIACEAEVSDLSETARKALRGLSEPHSEALILKYINGLSMEELAAVMRKSIPATNSLLQRARTALRDAMGSAMPEIEWRQS